MVNEVETQLLVSIIIRLLQEEFSLKHLSGNLINTITVEQEGNRTRINIPAQTYNMLLYQSKGVVLHTGHGSYASKLDEEGSSFMIYPNENRKGSFRISPRNHKGYVENVIARAIQEWKDILGERVKNIKE